MKYMNLLKKSILFQGIEDCEFDKLLKCLKAKEVKFQKGEMILCYGNVTNSMGMMLQGKAMIVKDDYWGNRFIINEIHQGELFGEAYACIPEQKLEISLIADEPCNVLFLNIVEITGICHLTCPSHNQLIRNLLAITSRKNIMLTQKMEHIMKKTTREKILSYLSAQSMKQNSQRILIPFNRQQLAEYLSVDRSALSNELSKMQKEGMISYHKNEFYLIK